MSVSISTALERYQPILADIEQVTLVGFLAGYLGFTRETYALDLRLFMGWCWQHDRHMFDIHCVDIECVARGLEDHGKARATVARRLSTVVGCYRYAEAEGVMEHSPAVHIRRPHVASRLHHRRSRRRRAVARRARGRQSLDRHATYIVATFIAGASR